MIAEKYTQYFGDKKVTVMGLGLLGRGVGDAKFLAECGAEVTVTDLKSEGELQQSVDVLREYRNVTFSLGAHRNEDFQDKDLILVAAGVPSDSPYIAHARAAGARTVMSGALFALLSDIPIIGITGTRGKSTVTHMIHHVLTQATGESVLLGGNVRGVSNLQLLKDVRTDSVAVMELDSWQLQGFGWEEISPQISVFTNFMPDHLNYYQREGVSTADALDAYFADKANIFLYQEDDGVFVTTLEVFEHAKQFASGRHVTLGQEVVLADASTLPEDCLLAMPGAHNRLNAALAYEALKATSLTDQEIFDGLASFPGVPGRMEYLGERDGVKVYNDNNATTPQATIAALEALIDTDNLVLIVGGSDKGLPVEALSQKIADMGVRVVLYSGTGTEKLKETLSHEVTHEEHDTLEACVHAALAYGERGTVLFSPAFASFGHEFKNEYDRNDQFMDIVKPV